MSKSLRVFAVFFVVLTLIFGRPLLELVQFSLRTELHSHAILIPLLSAYLLWQLRGHALPVASPSPALAVAPLALGFVTLKPALFPGAGMVPWAQSDRLAVATFCYLLFLYSGVLLILGGRLFRALLFPLCFLIFLIPLPVAAENALEIFFQHASAEATDWIFSIPGMTFFRKGLIFDLPGISIRVAQECSGIRSSLVLFITSLLAGQMFLHSPWRRTVLALFVVPLGIVRNGFRIFTISYLCVHVSPSMIDSPIHHRGGPFFFLLSLIPFFAFLFWLRKGERSRGGEVTHE